MRNRGLPSDQLKPRPQRPSPSLNREEATRNDQENAKANCEATPPIHGLWLLPLFLSLSDILHWEIGRHGPTRWEGLTGMG